MQGLNTQWLNTLWLNTPWLNTQGLNTQRLSRQGLNTQELNTWGLSVCHFLWIRSPGQASGSLLSFSDAIVIVPAQAWVSSEDPTGETSLHDRLVAVGRTQLLEAVGLSTSFLLTVDQRLCLVPCHLAFPSIATRFITASKRKREPTARQKS